MKIGVISATGKLGKMIFDEAVKNGDDVTAIIRDSKKAEQFDGKVIVKDIFDLEYEDLAPFDVIVDAFGTHDPSAMHLHTEVIEKLASILENKPNRLIVVGGAGSLYVDPEHSTQLFETDGFPEAFKPMAMAQSKALDLLRTYASVNWTFISPAADFRYDGKKTGNVLVSGEEFTLNSKKESQISYIDYAVALLEEAKAGRHLKERISFIEK